MISHLKPQRASLREMVLVIRRSAPFLLKVECSCDEQSEQRKKVGTRDREGDCFNYRQLSGTEVAREVQYGITQTISPIIYKI